MPLTVEMGWQSGQALSCETSRVNELHDEEDPLSDCPPGGLSLSAVLLAVCQSSFPGFRMVPEMRD